MGNLHVENIKSGLVTPIAIHVPFPSTTCTKYYNQLILAEKTDRRITDQYRAVDSLNQTQNADEI